MDIIQYLNDKHNIVLNNQQQIAVKSDDKNILLLAVPGSGKTTVLVSRIAYLMIEKSIDYQNILTLTFSKESAKDMSRRFEKLFSDIVFKTPQFCTIHSFCYSVLKHYSNIYGRDMPKLIETNKNINKSKMLRSIYLAVKEEFIADDMLENLSNDIGYYKNMMLTENNFDKYLDTDKDFIKILNEYERLKKEYKLMDYDDILIYALEILKKLPNILEFFKKRYKYINVDEAQDTSKVQYEILKQFSNSSNYFVVGDEDQCIYMFRGAYPQGLLDFSKNYKDTQILKIEENYRSNKDIVEIANEFIKVNKNRYPKQMKTKNNKENSIKYVQLDDYNKQYENILKDISNIELNKTVGILYRNNESAVPLINLFMHKNIDFYIKEKNLKFFSSVVVKDILSYFTLAYDPKNLDAFERIYFKCKCNKSIFIYAKQKVHNYSSVFEACAHYPGVEAYQSKHFMKCHNIIMNLKNKRPFSAIQKIENELCYKEYLDLKIKKGMNPLNPILKLNILKTLSKEYNTITEFVDNIYSLEKGLSMMYNKSSNITLSSIHSSKGLEFDYVYLIDFIDSIIPDISSIDNASYDMYEEMESEARLFYVAFTRAKDQIVIYTSKFCNDEYVIKSRFITRIQETKETKNRIKKKIVKLKGKKIIHKKFGKGIILSDSMDDIFKVKFEKYGDKDLSYSTCLKNGDKFL